MILGWLETCFKILGNLLEPLTRRIGNWLGRKTPRIYVHPNRSQSLWCIAWHGAQIPENEMMQLVFWGDFTQDDPDQAIIVTDAYPKGTEPQIGFVSKFTIPPRTMVHEQIGVFVYPIKGERGKTFATKFILVDQFLRKHKTQKIKFRWAGGPTASVEEKPKG